MLFQNSCVVPLGITATVNLLPDCGPVFPQLSKKSSAVKTTSRAIGLFILSVPFGSVLIPDSRSGCEAERGHHVRQRRRRLVPSKQNTNHFSRYALRRTGCRR